MLKGILKLSSLSYSLLLMGLYVSIFFINKNIGSYGLIHIYAVIILLWFIVWRTKDSSIEFFLLDKVVIIQLGFLFIVLLSYIVNLQYYHAVERVYYYTIGNSPPFLYLKICLTGIFSVLISWVGYKLGKVLITNHDRLKTFVWTLLVIIFINSLVNLIAWGIQTGAVLGRYNFDPPITGTPGLSIQLSIVGFIIGLSLLKFYKKGGAVNWMLKGILVIVFSNVVIIFTRQSQVTFLAVLMLYYLLNNKINVKKVLYLLFCVFIGLGLFIYLMVASGNIDAYLNINSTDAVDVAIRLTTINSAYNIFLENPIFGIGYGMFSGHNMVPIFITGVEVYLASPHNGMVSLLCELGVVGLLYYIYLNTYIIMKLNKIRKNINDHSVRSVVTAIFSIQVVFSLSVIISNSHLFGPPSELSYTCFAFISWVLIGVCFSVPKWDAVRI